MEQSGQFSDNTVVGGMDLFLQRWSVELAGKITLDSLYKDMSLSQRKQWAEKIMDSLGGNLGIVIVDKGLKKDSNLALTGKDDILKLRSINKRNVSKFRQLGIENIIDLAYMFPRRHNDFANKCNISELIPGQEQTIIGVLWEASEKKIGLRLRSTQAVISDETGNIRVTWFNQPYLAKTFKTGDTIVISGKVGIFKGRKVFESPEYELLRGDEELIHTGRLVPVYHAVDGLSQRTLRRAVNEALKISVTEIQDFIPRDILHRNNLIKLQNAIQQAHYPDNIEAKLIARRRLAFDELFLIQLSVLTYKRMWQQNGEAIPLNPDKALIDMFTDSLPFDLTKAQERVLIEILDDMESDSPMSRLLQGDVGSGKTVIAIAALLIAAVNGYQGALMVPTEILAEQHFLSIFKLIKSTGKLEQQDNVLCIKFQGIPRKFYIALLTGSQTKSVKEDIREKLSEGKIDIVIGTHALIQKDIQIPWLALIVIDEQHRFGVEQRAALREKGKRPHMLAMSATPIPRSLSLTLYGDLDISTIDKLPLGRGKIRTRWIQPEQRDQAYQFLRKEVEAKRQAFVICPLINESQTIQAKAAIAEHKYLSEHVYPDLRLGLLHGRMPLSEKQRVMETFQSRELDILVSTPVIEVGIDVPNATVMLIEGANRFGLAQLHQFRGRVGRGIHQSYCLLLAETASSDTRERLRILERTNDGFIVAEEDLNFRGPGDYLGKRQSGIANLKMAKLTDQDILKIARREAILILDSDSRLESKEHRILAHEMERYAIENVAEIS